jgi:hypothetical protein
MHRFSACFTSKRLTCVRLRCMTARPCSTRRPRSCSTGWGCPRWREMSAHARGGTVMARRLSVSTRGCAASRTLRAWSSAIRPRDRPHDPGGQNTQARGHGTGRGRLMAANRSEVARLPADLDNAESDREIVDWFGAGMDYPDEETRQAFMLEAHATGRYERVRAALDRHAAAAAGAIDNGSEASYGSGLYERGRDSGRRRRPTRSGRPW